MLRRLSVLLMPLLLGTCTLSRPEGKTCHRTDANRHVSPTVSFTTNVTPRAYLNEPLQPLRVAGRNSVFVNHLADIVLRAHARKNYTPIVHVLAISAGGQWGAYGAGVLAGSSNTPPRYDVITGVSTGALLAPLIFIGDYVEARKQYTNLSTPDVYYQRPAIDLLWSDSLLDTTPLKEKIEAIVNVDFVNKIADEADKGRILAVESTDLDSGDPIVFDLTKIAKGELKQCGSGVTPRDCIISAMLAASAFPVAFPPSFIDGEMFVDGGLRDYAFSIRLTDAVLHHPGEIKKRLTAAAPDFLILSTRSPDPDASGMDLTLIADTDFQYPGTCTGRSILGIAGRTASIAIDEIQSGVFYRLLEEVESKKDNTARYTFADPGVTGCTLPQTSNNGGIDMFDKKYMQCLYRSGCELAQSGRLKWYSDPSQIPDSPVLRPGSIKNRPPKGGEGICDISE